MEVAFLRTEWTQRTTRDVVEILSDIPVFLGKQEAEAIRI